LISTLILSLICSFIVYFFGDQISRIYTNEHHVSEQIKMTIPIYACSITLNFMEEVLAGIVRGMGL